MIFAVIKTEYTDIPWVCLFQGIGTHIGSLLAIGYTTASSFLIHRVIRSPASIENNLTAVRIIMHLIIWVIGFYGISLPTWLDLYGIAQGHCWIEKKGHGIVARLYTFYGILWAAILYMLIVYYKLRKHQGGIASPIISKIHFFPFALLMGYLAATSKRFYDLLGVKLLRLDNPNVEFGFQCAMYIGLMLVGFFDGIWYGWLWFGDRRARIQYDSTMESHTNADTESPGKIIGKFSHIENSDEVDIEMGIKDVYP